MPGSRPFGMLPDFFYYTIPASNTEEGKQRLSAYYEALGRFVDMFSRVETLVTLTLWHYAKTSPEIAKVIFAGARMDISSTYIKQLAEATGAPKDLQDNLAYVLQQASIINKARNDVLHYGAEFVAEGQAFVSNALRAKGKPTSFPISPDLLDDMTADLLRISAHLNYRHLMVAKSDEDQADLVVITRALSEGPPWRYKHREHSPEQPKRDQVPRRSKRDPK
jgi:hypothetical protein